LGGIVADTSPSSQAEVVYRAIRRDIIRCLLAPGQQVSEADLVERYGAGRSAVRSALSRLGQEGWVSVQARQGYRVAPLTLRHVRDLCGARLLLEPPAARMAAAGQVDVEHLRALDAQYRACAELSLPEDERLETLMRVNSTFHLAVAEAAGNRKVVELIAGLLDEMERLFHFGFKAGSPSANLHEHHHADLIAALAVRDGALAERLIAEQILATQRLIVDALLASPALDEVNLTLA
jgi:DNA-binding GntR family transcriptional regulator